ncbi:MAG: 5'-methylthioadenosine/adenosylhomocysteine nucleosidase [Cardiobacteriaceae bacterium]|nr:5'-methylthioadenosine/adenosylhomocysteine nucleosidase [Cardiobacteriaceae bacterium]
MKTIAIIAAMPEELLDLSHHLSDISQETIHGKEITTGYFDGKRIVLTLSGIGKVNAAFATALVVLQYKPDVVLNTGSAGALSADLDFADVVIADKLTQYDVDISKFGYSIGQIPGMSQFLHVDNELSTCVEEEFAATAASSDIKIHRGLIVSGDKFIDGKDKKTAILHDFPDALVCEMEGAAIAQICVQAKISFAVVRSVSDKADESSGVDFEKFIKEASKRSAEVILRLLQKL